MYLFLWDYMPEGLTGDSLAFINGDNVMAHLFCHIEFSMSKHKLAKDAAAAFSELEAWIRRGDNWEEALKSAKEEDERDAERAEQAGTPRRRFAWKAPGLQWPAGLLALLIIGHPDSKFRDRIVKLDVAWMMARRATLDVREGFWKGINAASLHKIFSPAPDRLPVLPLPLDYTCIFGRGFLPGRRHLRAFLPQPWDKVSIEREPSLVGEDGQADSSTQPLVRPDPLGKLRRHLLSATTKRPAQLREWLTNQVSRGSDDLLATWCEDWAGKMESAENYEQQLLIQSLFMQSLGRLEGLDTEEETITTEAYVLLDMADGDLKLQGEDPAQGDVLRDLKLSPAYAAYAFTCEELSRLICSARHGLYGRISNQQACFFHKILKHETWHKYFKDVVAFDDLRLQVVIQCSESSTPSCGPGPVDDHTTPSPGNERDILLEQHKIDSLKLTNWQLLMLLGGAVVSDVLTKRQYGIFRQEADPDGMHFIDLSRALPVTLRTALGTPLAENSGEKNGGKLEVIDKLFRDLSQDTAGRGRSESSLSTAPSLGLSPQTPVSTRSSRTTQPAAIKPNQAVPQTPPIGYLSQPASPHRHSPRELSTPTQPARDKEGGSMPEELSKAWSIFAGKVAPAKRGPSSSWGNSKRPRIEALGREELREELEAVKEQLKTEVWAELAADRATMKDARAGVEGVANKLDNSQTTIQGLERELGRVAEQIASLDERLDERVREKVMSATTTLISEIHEARDAVRHGVDQIVKDRVDAANTALARQLNELKDSCSRANIGQAVKEEVQAANETLMREFHQVRESFAKEPAAGRDGFLRRHCPAVEEWDGDQGAYEPMLFRAASYYIFQLLGNPDEGVAADENAIKDTMARFPDPPLNHLVTGLEHVHYLAYHRAFDKG